jgi:hypothetical protein
MLSRRYNVTFDLPLNLKTAKLLGITLREQADR